MEYISTRGNAEPRNFKDILLEGLAPDGGLYMPSQYPQLIDIDLELLQNRRYSTVAQKILRIFAPDIPNRTLGAIVRSVYTKENFGSAQIAPLKKLEPNLALLELSNGPTLSFKDVALQLLGALMDYVLAERDETLNILGATSGDTGSAAEYAIAGKERIRIFMLSPDGRMSEFQRRQMHTLNERNIFNLAVNGTFDDCQSVVKEVNADAEFKARYRLGAVNSINWARIAIQVVYYIDAYLHMVTRIGDHVVFAVPSGNFGNALSAYIAKRMGLPIDIIVCTNENDVLYELFRTGIYRVRRSSEVKVTSSPSMDIAKASNIERFFLDYFYRDAAVVSQVMRKLATAGEVDLLRNDPGAQYGISTGRATEAEVLEMIRRTYEQYKLVIDPHTAVAMKVARDYRPGYYPVVVAETAQPAKFASTIREALGFEAPVPPKYKDLGKLEEHVTRIEPDAETVKRFIASHVE